ncbi:MAG TPA: TlpA disulfide reductase family protein [Pyrinomonadaceae bacterium]|nr:TlpA disulfide reductase family protein [Pyrinomonadaceae bacterium]
MDQVVEKKSASRTSWLAGGLILALSLVNLLLIKQNFDLRKQLSGPGGKIGATANSLRAGEVVAPVAGSDLNGRPYELTYEAGGRRHLLLFFSPDCAYCVQQAPQWRDLLNTIDHDRFRVVGVVGDREDGRAVAAHAEELGYFRTKVPLPIVVFSNESLERYKLTATPTTLLIGDDGRVERSWVGRWDAIKASEVSLALK